jgi:hypothetical protein
MTKKTIKEMTPDERAALSKSIYTEGMFLPIHALIDVLGSEGALGALRPYGRMSGHAFAMNMLEMFAIDGRNIDKIAEISELFELMTGTPEGIPHDLDAESENDKIIRAGYLKCSNRAGPKEFCLYAHEMFLNGICEAIDPQFVCKFTQMITKGDPICSYIIEKKR